MQTRTAQLLVKADEVATAAWKHALATRAIRKSHMTARDRTVVYADPDRRGSRVESSEGSNRLGAFS